MTRKLADVIAAGKALDADERELASIALHYADEEHATADEQSQIDDAWDDEINSRIDDILSGRVELVDGEETMRMLRAELSARRAG